MMTKGGGSMVQNTKELYEKMLATPELCGKFELVDKTIFWDLFDGYNIQISIEPPATHFSIEKKLFWKITDTVTHWHPEQEDIYDEVCKIGLKGNVLVIRKNILFTSTIYMGKEELCPYSSKKKWSWGKVYYLKAK